MATPNNPARLAVLIDAENVSAQHADTLFQKLAKLGDPTLRRAYGDFRQPTLGSWIGKLKQHAIAPQQSLRNVAGKNAADIALVIDAMDLLHTGRFDAFCIVSSDSDFTALAVRLREQGVQVFGFGNSNAPEAFRNACNGFTNLGTAKPTPVAASSAAKPATQAVAKPAAPKPSHAEQILTEAMKQLPAEEGGWVQLSRLASRAHLVDTSFSSKAHGHSTFLKLAKAIASLEIRKNAAAVHEVRHKQMKSARAVPVPAIVAPVAESAFPTPVVTTCKSLPELRQRLSEAYVALDKNAEGWVRFNAIGAWLHATDPEFDIRAYGHETLRTLIIAVGGFEVRKIGSSRLHMRRIEIADTAVSPANTVAELQQRVQDEFGNANDQLVEDVPAEADLVEDEVVASDASADVASLPSIEPSLSAEEAAYAAELDAACKAALVVLDGVFAQMHVAQGNWVMLASLAAWLKQLVPDFTLEQFGFLTLKGLIDAIDELETRDDNGWPEVRRRPYALQVTG